MGKTIIVGDVHGCLFELEELLDRCSYHPDVDRLIFVGDLINRGNHSLEVLLLAYSLGSECVLGNHEVALLKYSEVGRTGGRGDLALLRRIQQRAPYLMDWIASWPLYIEEKDFVVVHAGVVPEYDIGETPQKILTHIRYWDPVHMRMNKYSGIPWFNFYKGKKLIVYGHWALKGLTVRRNTIGLDSGCVWGGSLSALILPEKEIVQVAAKRCYIKNGRD